MKTAQARQLLEEIQTIAGERSKDYTTASKYTIRTLQTIKRKLQELKPRE